MYKSHYITKFINKSSSRLLSKELLGRKNSRFLGQSRLVSTMEIQRPSCLLQPMHVPKKLLMGPGPSNAPDSVLKANSLPILGHLHPEFCKIMDECKQGIQYGFQTNNVVTLAISGTGHAAMESTVVNLVEPEDIVLVLNCGIWGERFSDMVERNDGIVKQLKKPPGNTFTLNEIEMGLKEHTPKVMFVTHGESSSCTCQNLDGIGNLCHRYGCVLIVDSVAAMGGVPLYMDKWEIDVLYTGSQKVLGVPPGVSPISFSSLAMDKVKNRKKRISSFYFDINMLASYWGCTDEPRMYHHTGPISSIYALREGLAVLAEETLEKSWSRHKECAAYLKEEIEKLGLQLFVKNEDDRLPTITGVIVPEGLDWKAVTMHVMSKHLIEIAGGLGPTAGKIWRIGLMGQNAKKECIDQMILALKDSLSVNNYEPSKL